MGYIIYMDIETIYFDMDGVLVDFNRGQREILGIEPKDQENKKPGDDDTLFALMRQHDHYYLDLEPIPGSIELFKKVHALYGDRCQILTGIPKPWRGIVNAEKDKREWARRYLGESVVVNAVLRKEKMKFVKGKGSVLIDDFSLNIKEWREAGGTGILFRSPEETETILETLEIINK